MISKLNYSKREWLQFIWRGYPIFGRFAKIKSLTDFISSYYIISQLTDIDENLLNDLETKRKQ